MKPAPAQTAGPLPVAAGLPALTFSQIHPIVHLVPTGNLAPAAPTVGTAAASTVGVALPSQDGSTPSPPSSPDSLAPGSPLNVMRNGKRVPCTNCM